MGLESEEIRRRNGNRDGKAFVPIHPRTELPAISSRFSYQHNQCKDWYDKWLMGGGTLLTDNMILVRPRDLPDLRTYGERLAYRKLELRMRACLTMLKMRHVFKRQHYDAKLISNVVPIRRST